MRLTLRQLNRYLDHIQMLTAKEAMVQATAASVPHMEEDARHELVNDWSLIAGMDPKTTSGSERISLEEFRQEIKQRIL